MRGGRELARGAFRLRAANVNVNVNVDCLPTHLKRQATRASQRPKPQGSKQGLWSRRVGEYPVDKRERVH